MNKKIIGSVIAAGLVLFGCSSDDSDTDDTTAATDAAATTAASESTAAAATTAVPATTAADAPTTSAGTSAGVDPADVLDASFGSGGVLPTPLSTTDADRFISVAEGPDGQIYASGFSAEGDDHMFAVARFDPDGTPDATFGDGGVATVNVAVGGGGAEVARGLVVEDDGAVLVAGPFENDPTADGDAAGDLDVAVIRLTADGTPDAAFGEAGIAKIDLGVGRAIDADTYITDNAWGLTAREGGYALFAVTPNQAADRTDVDYAVVGLTTAGALDPAFGTNGTTIVDLDASGDSARNIGTQPDGKILATGYSRDGDGIVSPVLIRLSPDGVLDETFGTAGVANHAVLPGVAESYQFGLQGDDYVLAGYGRGEDSEEKVDLIVYRFLADGSWDSSFGTEGVTRIDLAGEDDRARNLTMLPDGNILVVGSGKLDAANIDGLLVLLDPDGAPVESFGDGGHLLVDLGGPADAFFGVMVSTDESTAIVAGFKGADPQGTDNDDAVLAKLPL